MKSKTAYFVIENPKSIAGIFQNVHALFEQKKQK